jgi:protein TonB
MPRVFTLLSVAVHAIVIGCVVLAQFLDIGRLPVPRTVLAFTDRFVTIADIALPAPPRAPGRGAAHLSPARAPVEEPRAIEPEVPRSPSQSGIVANDALGAVEGGTGNIAGGVPGGKLVPPPPPPLPPPAQPVRLHQGMQAPRKIVDVSPTYPAMARAVRQEGLVILEAVIDARGVVDTVRVLRGFPLLNQAAIDAVRQWRFTPALLNGQPVPVVMTVTVNFVLK